VEEDKFTSQSEFFLGAGTGSESMLQSGTYMSGFDAASGFTHHSSPLVIED
jgi:hypothetical protein